VESGDDSYSSYTPSEADHSFLPAEDLEEQHDDMKDLDEGVQYTVQSL